MSRRIDIELTSALADGSWTWRAAGARHPKGVVAGSILPSDAKVGDELKVEVEQEIDGITILCVVHGRQKPNRNDVIELLPAEREFQPVVETRAPGGRSRGRDGERRPRRDEGDRGERRPRREGGGGDRDRADRSGPGREGDRGPRSPRPEGGDRRPRREGADRPRRGPSFTPPPEVPQRPKPQRLKPGKTHRSAVLADLPEEQRPIAELALQGLAAVRQRVRDENAKAVADGRAQMPEATVMKMAEDLLPKLRVAEWRDRAEAAQKQVAQLDLRDLRSVVAAANDPMVARDESTRTLAQELTQALATKQEQELQLWFGDVDAALAVGRVIRALRLSSQPPKAGVPFPADIAQRLIDSTNASLAPMDPPDRWAAMLEAAAFSPIRLQIKPQRKPDVVNDELLATVKRLAPALPQVAAMFEIEVDPKASMPKPLRPGPRPGGKDAKKDTRKDAKPEAKRDKPAKAKPEAPVDAESNARVENEASASPTDELVERAVATGGAPAPATTSSDSAAESQPDQPATEPAETEIQADLAEIAATAELVDDAEQATASEQGAAPATTSSDSAAESQPDQPATEPAETEIQADLAEIAATSDDSTDESANA